MLAKRGGVQVRTGSGGMFPNSSLRKISRVVWQTVRSRSGLSNSFNASWKSMVKANPGWTFNLVDNEDMERTVQGHAPAAAMQAFRSINRAFGAARADFWRYLVLLSLGGVYFDADICLNMPLDDVITISETCVLFSEPNVFPYDWNTTLGGVQPHTEHEQIRRYLRWPADGTRACGLPPIVVAQWFIAAEPGHPLLREAVRLVTAQVQAWDDANPVSREFDSKTKVLYLTGPSIWNRAIRNTRSALRGCAERGRELRDERETGGMRINELDVRFHKSWFHIMSKQKLSGYVSSKLPAVPAIRYEVSLFKPHDQWQRSAPLCISEKGHTIQESWQRQSSHANSPCACILVRARHFNLRCPTKSIRTSLRRSVSMGQSKQYHPIHCQ